MKGLLTTIWIICVFSAYGEKSIPLKVQVHCGEKMLTQKITTLCPSKKKACAWKNIVKSKTASSWDKDQGRIQVIEVPNENLVRIQFHKGPNRLKLPWCDNLDEINLESLKPSELKEVKKKGEVIYILKKNSSRWNLLKSIDHPCRSLQTFELKNGFFRAYLLPTNKRGC
ncbi:MAG: hypothetical protein K9K67_09765 [Bacteriovoracaceae bacterium]|nr:hypothetical protein [Bacteriovoracaceae bacterium]